MVSELLKNYTWGAQKWTYLIHQLFYEESSVDPLLSVEGRER